jgi:hypothetical protein
MKYLMRGRRCDLLMTRGSSSLGSRRVGVELETRARMASRGIKDSSGTGLRMIRRRARSQRFGNVGIEKRQTLVDLISTTRSHLRRENRQKRERHDKTSIPDAKLSSGSAARMVDGCLTSSAIS